MELIAWFSRFLSDLKYADNSPTPPVQWMTVGSPETTSTLSNLTIRENDLRVSRRLLYGVSMTKAAAMALVLMLRIKNANVAILENMLNIKASIWLLSAFVGQVTLRCWDLQGIRVGFYTLIWPSDIIFFCYSLVRGWVDCEIYFFLMSRTKQRFSCALFKNELHVLFPEVLCMKIVHDGLCACQTWE